MDTQCVATLCTLSLFCAINIFRPKSFTSKYCLSKYKVIHYILHQLPDINLDDDLICDNFFQNGEEYFERFPKFMKYNDYVVPCKETYACAFI